MNYFTVLEQNQQKLEAKANELLKGRPEKSLDDLASENCKLGWAWFNSENKNWDKVPEVVAAIADGWLPFSEDFVNSNGSLGFTLGLSMASLEAHAWALNDFLSGKTSEYEEPDFPLVAKVSEEQMEELKKLELA